MKSKLMMSAALAATFTFMASAAFAEPPAGKGKNKVKKMKDRVEQVDRERGERMEQMRGKKGKKNKGKNKDRDHDDDRDDDYDNDRDDDRQDGDHRKSSNFAGKSFGLGRGVLRGGS